MVWRKLGSTTLTSAGDTITVSGMTAKTYLMVLGHIIATTQVRSQFQFNYDTGLNYANRNSTNGGSDGTNTSMSRIYLNDLDKSSDCYFEAFIINESDKEKLIIYKDNWQDTAGAGTAPARTETVAKWANTSAQISSIQLLNDRAGNFAIGSEITVYGTDDNTPLGTSGNLQTNTIFEETDTGKHYIWDSSTSTWTLVA